MRSVRRPDRNQEHGDEKGAVETTRQQIEQPEDEDIDAAQLDTLRHLITAYSGVYLDRTRTHSLLVALKTRLAHQQMTVEEYVAQLKKPGGRAELQEISELLLNHETVFFRNQPHMQALREVILPTMHRRKTPQEPIRIWSAGCSTGEEPYSLAIVALEALGYPLPRPVHIWATDLSRAALERARKGVYKGRTLSNVTPALAARYFRVVQGGMWAVNDIVRSLVHFEQFNLLEPFPAQARNLDIIFCQNVTIYFELETFRNLADRFYQALNEGGMLFLGFSETLWNIYDRFRLLEVNGSFLYVKETAKETAAPPHATSSTKGSSKPQTESQPMPKKLALRDRSASLAPPSGSANRDTLGKARELLDQGKTDEMLAMLSPEAFTGPCAPEALALVARAHANRGDFDLAIAEARRAIAINSLTTEAYLLLGILYAQQGQLQTAITQLERARYLNPDAPLISFHLAGVYARTGRVDAAIREYQSTLHKLAHYPADTVLDGVAVAWLRETCQRYQAMLRARRRTLPH